MKRKTKACLGCEDNFLTLKNYDYCKGCGINGSRYVNETKKLVKLTSEEEFWEQVEENSKWRIYETLTQNIPLQNVKLIEDNWGVGGVEKVEAAGKKVGFFPDKDTDYRVILRDDIPSYYTDNEEFQTKINDGNWDYEDVKFVADEVAFHYSLAVIKGIIRSLSAFDCYDPAYFENLTY